MSDAGRTTTSLDVRVNLRDLNRLDTKLKETFGTARARDFNRGLSTSERAVTGLLRATQQLTAELARQRDNSKHFSRMETDIVAARREAEKLRAELERVRAAAGGGGPAGGGMGSGGGGGRGSGGGGGPAMGSGGPSWGRRFAGAQVGVPDASGLATAMSAIPVLGLAAAGATMASYSMYGSALGYQTARRDTFAQLGPQGADMLGLRQTRQATEKHTIGDSEVARIIGSVYAGKRMHLPSPVVRKLQDFYSVFDENVLDTGVASGFESLIAEGAREAGYKMRVVPGQSAQWNAPMSTADLERVGTSYGVKPGDALREAGGLSSAMGRRTSAETYDFARSAQTYFGVDMGTTGALMKGYRTAGGLDRQKDQANAVAQLIGTAVVRGLEGSEIATYLESMAGFMQKQADLGQFEQSTEGFASASKRLSQSWFNPSFSASYAMRLGESASQMGYGGEGTAEQFMMLQKLGYGAGGRYTGEGYAEAMMQLQDPDKAVGAALSTMSDFSDRMRDTDMGPEARALMMSRLSAKLGAQVGPDAARLMAEGINGPGLAPDPTVGAADITRVHREARGKAVGVLAAEAGMEADRIGAGYKAAGQVQDLNGVMIDLANTVQDKAGPALSALTRTIKEMTAAARVWHPGEGSGVGSAGGRKKK